MPLVLTSVPDLVGGVSQQPISQRLPNQCQAQTNAMPLIVGGLIKRPPTNHVSEVTAVGGASINSTNMFTHVVQRDNTEQYIVMLDGQGGVKVSELDGTAKTVVIDSGLDADDYYIGNSGGDTGDIANPAETLRAFTIADVTYIVNTSIKPEMKTGSSDLAVQSREKTAAPFEALIVLKASGIGNVWEVTLGRDGVTPYTVRVTHTVTDAAGGAIAEGDNVNPVVPSIVEIAKALALGGTGYTNLTVTNSTDSFGGGSTTGLNNFTNVNAVAKNGVIFLEDVTGAGPADFSVVVENNFGDAGFTVVRESTTFFSDLPTTAPHKMIVKVEGSPETSVDDYYVKFLADGETTIGDMKEGSWVEVPRPGVATDYNAATLPHILVRQPNGSFVYTDANGVTPAGGTIDTSVDWASFKFTPRETGDDLTNPLPSFIGQEITDISFFKNRLVVTSGENVSLSEVGFFFNFFRTTVTQLLDSSVIDVGVGGTVVSKLDRAVPFSDRLMLFSERSQFSLAGESILSPLTVSVTNVTDFDVDTSAAPVASGTSLFFPFKRGSFTGFQEYFKASSAATDIQFDANEITSQVPTYITGSTRKIAASTHENLVAVLAGSNTELYLYKYFNTRQQRMQSAWFKFEFTNVTLLNIEFVGTSLFLLVNRNSKTYIERIDLQTGLTDEGSTYVTTLDRRVHYAQSGGTTGVTRASADTVTTTYHLTGLQFPTVSTAASDGVTQAVTSTGDRLTVNSATWDGSKTIVVVQGEIPATTKVFFGEPYTMTYEFTKPLLKRAREGGVDIISTGRHQLRYMTLEYDNTAAFSLRVTPIIGGAEGTPVTYPFSGRFLAATNADSVPRETGSFRVPIFLKSLNAKIEIINSSPLPSNIQSAEFEAQYTTRIEQQA